MKGSDATHEDMDLNCERIISIAKYLRTQLSGDIEIYVPAEHEEFVQISYDKGWLTEEQILEIDCDIISRGDVVLCHVQESLGDELQGGREIEVKHAIKTGKAHFIFEQPDEALIWLSEYASKV
jgi:hypothetical protein